jgi:hypothetical protein
MQTQEAPDALLSLASVIALIRPVLEVTIPWPPGRRPGRIREMRKMRWFVYLWPGLAQLWTYGSWSGLTVAIGAAVGLDLLLLASFGWSELIGPSVRNTLWAAFGVSWIITASWSARQCGRRTAVESVDPRQDGFATALDHYLKGDYYQAEQVLEGLLRRNFRDLEARLMLATLLRHTGRLDEAVGQLDTLARFEGAGKWELEMRRERELLVEAKSQKATAA